MNYRKFKADHLFTGFKFSPGTNVLITSPEGEIISIVNEGDAGGDIEVFKGILTPGFVNTHCHLELSHLHGRFPEKTGLVDFVYKVVTERHFPGEQIADGIDKAIDEMLLNGIVATGDICNNDSTITHKLQGKIACHNFIEVSGWLPSLSEARWQRSRDLYHRFLKDNLPASVVPHAPYSVSDNLWKHMSRFFENQVLSIHNQETSFEDEFFLDGTGDLVRMYELMKIDNSFFRPGKKTSLQTYFDKLSTAASVILVHNTFTTEADILFVKQSKPSQQLVSFCLCPNANLYIENTLPPVEMFLANNCTITLGTDSLASNYSLDILEEMKTIMKNVSVVSLEEVLQWATINGARALQMDNVFGSFEAGKKPGIVLVENIVAEKFSIDSKAVRLL